MKFRATNEQVVEMYRLAINASTPTGLGFLSFQERDFTTEDARAVVLSQIEKGRYVSADYEEGRMVKLHLRICAPGVYEVPDYNPRSDYQSWCWKYPTYRALVDAAGGALVGDAEMKP